MQSISIVSKILKSVTKDMALSINVGQWNGVGLRNQPGGARLCRDFAELLRREPQRLPLPWSFQRAKPPGGAGRGGGGGRILSGRRGGCWDSSLQLAPEVCGAGFASFRTFSTCVAAHATTTTTSSGWLALFEGSPGRIWPWSNMHPGKLDCPCGTSGQR